MAHDMAAEPVFLVSARYDFSRCPYPRQASASVPFHDDDDDIQITLR